MNKIREIVYEIEHSDMSDEQKKFWIKYSENKDYDPNIPYAPTPKELVNVMKELSARLRLEESQNKKKKRME